MFASYVEEHSLRPPWVSAAELQSAVEGKRLSWLWLLVPTAEQAVELQAVLGTTELWVTTPMRRATQRRQWSVAMERTACPTG